jgi:asparagine synthase (glutamine-hydrolysing)
LVPRAILYRPKQGFSNDLAPYFRANAARLRARLGGPVLRACGLFDDAAIANMIDEHEAGGTNHAQAIWLLLAYEGFLHMLDMADSKAAAPERAA